MNQPPYGMIWDALQEGRVIPFLGAGASLIGKPPPSDQAAAEAWEPADGGFLPSGGELSRFLARESGLETDDPEDASDLAKVATYVIDQTSRDDLRRSLRRAFTRAYAPTPLHALLASVPVPLVVFSTNYDTLLEQAFQAAGKTYDLVVYPADQKENANAVLWWQGDEGEPVPIEPGALDIDLEATSVIYKMHGTVVPQASEWDTFVITQDDYVDFVYRMTGHTVVPAIFYDHFRDRRFLFLGYGLRDWNWWVVLRSLKVSRRRARPDADGAEEAADWAIQLDSSPLDQELWKMRRLNIYKVALEEFVEKLLGEGR